MPKKILFIGSFSLPKNGFYGGVHQATTSLAYSLRKEGYEIVELDTTIKDISKTGVFRRLPSLFTRMLKFSTKIVKNRKAETLLVFVSAGNSYLDKLIPISIAKSFGIKIIVFPRSGLVVRDLNKNIYRKIVRFTLNKADFVICQSKYWKEVFLKLSIPSKKLIIIENWLEDQSIKISENLSVTQFHKDQQSFKMVFLSRIEKEKGMDDLILLADQLKKQNVDFLIDVYGAGSYLEVFLKETEEKNLSSYIFYKGWLSPDQKLQLLNNYHLTIFPSRTEGYPNSILDFILAKIPIIAYDIPAISHVFSDALEYYKTNEDLVEKVGEVLEYFDSYQYKILDLNRRILKQNAIETAVCKIKELI